ncbi:class I SAM-dependent methyltransferase [Fontimonas thermophila]|uniref:class I SAM-dependent methyltransferase n=1 Tax=Fontimonas thermophila TaxID=1076937 RepID=UPI001F16F449|nr:class I SAM-dependent methyltransferase [Fontimonas thermophila]
MQDINPTVFAFGENWRHYADGIDERHIEQAIAGLRRLFGDAPLTGKRFLDLGCGSGIHAAAAVRLGATVTALDRDATCVATTRAVLQRFCPEHTAIVERADILTLTPETFGRFDYVYSWGVLHHTGDLRGALRRACALVAPQGLLAIAIYKKSWLCWAWALEKRWYTERASPRARRWAQRLYQAAWRLNLTLKGIDYNTYVREYPRARGMRFETDVADWLGGWPYESATRSQIEAWVGREGFTLVHCNVSPSRLGGRTLGLFGTRCDEFVFRRSDSSP